METHQGPQRDAAGPDRPTANASSTPVAGMWPALLAPGPRRKWPRKHEPALPCAQPNLCEARVGVCAGSVPACSGRSTRGSSSTGGPVACLECASASQHAMHEAREAAVARQPTGLSTQVDASSFSWMGMQPAPRIPPQARLLSLRCSQEPAMWKAASVFQTHQLEVPVGPPQLPCWHVACYTVCRFSPPINSAVLPMSARNSTLNDHGRTCCEYV